MFDPGTWAGIAEKLGIPFALLLMVFCMLFVALRWIAFNVVKPLVESHVSVVNGIKAATQLTAEKQGDILTSQQVQTVKLDKICDTIDRQTDELKIILQPKAA